MPLDSLYRAHGFVPLDAPTDAERLAVIDLDAVEHNVRRIKTLIGQRSLIAVVKADAYGHGALEVAHSAVAAGADYLGVVHVKEAHALRSGGIAAPIIAWLHTPRTNFAQALEDQLELGVSSTWELEAIAAAHRASGQKEPVRIHLKVDTGLGRNGVTMAELPALAAAARRLEEAGLLEVVGVFSHLAVADEPERTETAEQSSTFDRALEILHSAGLRPTLRHLANTPATFSAASVGAEEGLLRDAVRVGLGLYGLSPLTGSTPEELGLRPVMHLQTFINTVKEVPAGQGVSYGLNYVTDKPTTLALVPVGYADGVPRVATGGPVRIYPATGPARTYREVGRIAMDQLVVDLGEPGLADPAAGFLGAPAVLFGSGDNPPVTDWAEAAGTINYEIVTRISPRVTRISVGGSWKDKN
ncbi:MAG: alanine racemase [Rothia sp. (in: high G+C Gram-positive bacteria)]|uniref:alanine racemase n=1 Tax=Rothia sp. (in: high G+C Gram-positive bacteria) TaxID=1885016 RepID=UPI0027008C4E|nr:alanine racemase [Rothia sp. (in: high G+C Gram-positive bacteria)]